jgi:hypothetical protein
MDATATAKLALDASGLDRGLQSATASVDRFAKQTGALLVGAFAFDKLISGFSSAIEKGDQLQDLANRFGISASALQEVGNAASLSGAGIEDVASAMNKLAVNAGKAIGGDDAMKQAFLDIGLSVQQLKEMSPQDIFFALSEAIQNTSNPLEAFAKAQAVAGKSVGALMETMRMGPAAIKELGDSMGVWSDNQITQLGAASDAIKEFQTTQTIWFGKTLIGLKGLIERYQDLTEAIALSVAARFTKGLDNAGRASLMEESSAKAADVLMGRSEIQKNAQGQGRAEINKDAVKSQKDLDNAEKDAIKERTDLALSILKSEDAEKKLANDSYERKRDIERERMLEAANLQVKAAQEKMKLQQEQATREKNMAAGPGGTSRQFEQARGGAASEVLNFATGLGDRGISNAVEQERAKAAKEQQKVNRKEFDAKVMEQTSALTSGGNPRTMESRRREFIQKEAQKESKGTKSLSDIYEVLDTALKKITATPIVAV